MHRFLSTLSNMGKYHYLTKNIPLRKIVLFKKEIQKIREAKTLDYQQLYTQKTTGLFTVQQQVQEGLHKKK